MGFMATSKEYPLTVLMPGFQVDCTLQVFGLLQTFINDEQRGILSLTNATLYGLEQGNPARSVSVPELFVRKDQCHALAFETLFSQEQTGLMARSEPLAVYTSHYVIQGQVHMGSDALIGDVFDASKAMFVGITDAYIFSLFTPQAALIQQAPLVYVYRRAVWMHHKA